MSNSGPRPGQKRKYCGHCQQYLALPVYKRHNADYYNPATRTWWTADAPMYDESRDAEDDHIIKSSMLVDIV